MKELLEKVIMGFTVSFVKPGMGLNALRFLIVWSVAVGFTSQGLADSIPPGEVEVHTASYERAPVQVTPERYLYDIKWQGIPVATAEIIADYASKGSDRSMAHVTALAKTARGIDLFYRLRHISESYFQVGSFRPVRYLLRQKENSRFKFIEIDFTKPESVVTTFRKDEEAPEVTEFNPNNFMLDPISASMLARTIPVAEGSTASFDVYNGKNRYLIRFEVGSKEKIKRPDGNKVDAYRVVPTVQKLTDTKGEKRIESCTIWLSADERRDILRMESKVLIGRITATLRETAPLNASEGLLQAKLDISKDLPK